jgi:isoaspartyl peptidase/L-asparaginase-like protein (Ntn-hydrolase superfamily)
MHPISVARAVMEKTPHVMLSGEGALQFALSQGFKKENLLTEKSRQAWEEWKKVAKYEPKVNIERHDTIGLLALGKAGEIAGACSTSGMAFKMHGRVGDSPIIGAGLFIDNEIGGAVATGLGEAIIRIAGSHTVVELMRQGFSPQEACKMAVDRILSKHTDLTNLQCCFLAIDKKGNVGSYSVYNGFNYALKTAKAEKMVDAEFNRSW